MKTKQKSQFQYDIFALELARAWKNGGVDASILSAYSLANDAYSMMHGKGGNPEYLEQAFKTAYDLVSLLTECGVFKKSPDIEGLGFAAPDVKHPELQICWEMNARRDLFEMPHELAFEDGRFIDKTIVPHHVNAYVSAGIVQIATANGEALYGVCQLETCGEIFRKSTQRGMFCSTSHKVRASQLRLKNSES